MQLNEFDFELPPSLIANAPLAERSASRLLCLSRQDGAIQHCYFRDVVNLISPGDLLVLNNTRVIPARVFGYKPTGGRIELLIERLLTQQSALAHIRASKGFKKNSYFYLDDSDVKVEVIAKHEALYECYFHSDVPLRALLDEIGHIPLPPYIKRPDNAADRQRYQTVFAVHEGSVAAPTAGLHFDEALLQQLQQQGVQIAYVTLHVGAGTFQPIRTADIYQHRMHHEWCYVPPQVCARVRATKSAGKRVIAVGTTTVRSLETAAVNGEIQPFEGETNLFIYPGYSFHVIDSMITNFHLPQSTLLMLVCAFAGTSHTVAAYQTAIAQQYRFYSYGDAMFIR